MEKYMYTKKRTVSEDVDEGPTLKHARFTENTEFEIDGVTDIATTLADDSIQHDLKSYPKRKFETQFRLFQKEWFHARP